VRTFLITGCSTGIGEACVVRLAGAGHRVFAGVRTEGDGNRLVTRAGSGVVPVLLDVTDEAQVRAVAQRLEDELGPSGLDGLVNNAAISLGGPIEYVHLDEWRRIFEVNVIGQVAVTRAMIPLVRRARGRVVFLSSMFGRLAMPFLAPYCASKHAIEAIGESLREELRPWDVGVILVEPGAVRTPIWAKGRSYAEEFLADVGAEGLALYGEAAEHMMDAIDTEERIGIPPERVAAVVEEALTRRHPHYRYLVGRDARGVGLLDRFAPDRAMEYLAARLSP
jgi:NAD(P)-dependent dehydrogenase (short-subunit alcohol dehydrogenase family)